MNIKIDGKEYTLVPLKRKKKKKNGSLSAQQECLLEQLANRNTNAHYAAKENMSTQMKIPLEIETIIVIQNVKIVTQNEYYTAIQE